MPKYKIPIVETLRRDIIVEAVDRDDAYEKLAERYYSEEIVLTADDFDDFEFGDITEITEEDK